MNEVLLKTLKQGMKNVGYWYGYTNRWNRGTVDEAIDLLEHKDELLEEYDCYDEYFR